MNNTGLPQIEIKGRGVMLPPGARELSPARQPGDYVWWASQGIKHGILKEWDNGTAIVIIDGQDIAVLG